LRHKWQSFDGKNDHVRLLENSPLKVSVSSLARRRQKVKPYFLPVQIAKKDEQSSSFFGVKTRKPHGRKNSALGLYGLKLGLACFKPKTKRRGYFLTLPKTAAKHFRLIDPQKLGWRVVVSPLISSEAVVALLLKSSASTSNSNKPLRSEESHEHKTCGIFVHEAVFRPR
jgi:hypothetical protein